MKRWKLESAKNGFSELVRDALADGPQVVTRHGRDAVVVMSVAEYERLVSPAGLVASLRTSPVAALLRELDTELPIDRGDTGRDLDI